MTIEEEKIQKEMKTIGGSSDPADFDNATGIYDGKNPPQWPALTYPYGEDPADAIDVTGGVVTAKIRMPKQGQPIEFKLRTGWLFAFKLTWDFYGVLDEAALGGITVKNSMGVSLDITITYKPSDQYHYVTLVNEVDADPLGYWVFYDSFSSYDILTQYPFRYKTAEQEQVGDLIFGGRYEDHIPYWRDNFSYVTEPIPLYDIITGQDCWNGVYGGAWNNGAGEGDYLGNNYYLMETNGDTVKKNKKLISSVPYKVTFKVGGISNIPFNLYMPDAYHKAVVEACVGDPANWNCLAGMSDIAIPNGFLFSSDQVDSCEMYGANWSLQTWEHEMAAHVDITGMTHWLNVLCNYPDSWTSGTLYYDCRPPGSTYYPTWLLFWSGCEKNALTILYEYEW